MGLNRGPSWQRKFNPRVSAAQAARATPRRHLRTMASALYQSIELLSREKGIEPGIVVGAVEEAIALATRKFYKTQENMRGELNKETGEITAYVYKTVVADEDEIEDPVNQISLDRSYRACAGRRGRQRDSHVPRHQPAGPYCRAACQAGDLPEGARGGARHGLPGVRTPREGSAERDGEAHRGPGRDLRPGQGRSALPQARAVAAGAVHDWRAIARGADQGGPRRQGTAGDCFAGCAGAGVEPVPDRKCRRFTTTRW